jgi:serine/threonine protein kinase
MMPDPRHQIRRLFAEALEHPAEDRERFLQQTCPDLALRAEVRRWLDAHAQSEEPTCALPLPSPFPPEDPITQMADRRIGSYQIIREIGRGGMGIVYLAQRADNAFQKRVALKLVRPGDEGPEGHHRFQQEREILASLDHPHIARLLDGGNTPEGAPYLVMEYVEGTPIIAYCNGRELNVASRLQLFQAVCDAVQYAHRQGIVHRDLKPSNILVTADGNVKLLDFGIAKLLRTDQTATLFETQRGLQVMTPEYASPEQVLGGQITVSTDVYALGVILYELITGPSPYRLNSRLPHEIARVVCEEEPIAPSMAVRLDELDGDSSTHLNALCEGGADKLRRRLTGDIDNIVLKALRKEPARRFESVDAFRDDLQRHLQGLPVSARRDTILYRVCKFLSRNRTTAAVATGSATVGLLLVVIIQATAGYRQDQTFTQVLEGVLASDLQSLADQQDSKPNGALSEWARLGGQINNRVLGDPTGRLALLARRAAVTAEVRQLPAYGLASGSPNIQMAVRRTLDISLPVPTIVDFEVRHNNGPWMLLKSVYCECERSRPSIWTEMPLERFFPSADLTAGSHHFDFRARLQIFESLTKELRDELLMNPKLRAGSLPGVQPLATDTRRAGTFDIRNLADLPEDYPQRITGDPCASDMPSKFRLTRVRVVRRRGISLMPNSISRVELFGVFNSNMACPIAAELLLRPGEGRTPLVSFPVAIGKALCRAGPGFSHCSGSERSYGDSNPHPIWTYITADFPSGSVNSPNISLPDGVTDGLADLEPRRLFALRTRLFDRYWGETLHFPVQLVISSDQ